MSSLSEVETSMAVPMALPTREPRPALTDDVYESIKGWIVDTVREPGVRANIDALARSLDVSPTPVREALARLDAEGLVTKARSRGYTVVPPLSSDQVADLFDFRLVLEPWAAGRAASASGAGAAQLRAELAGPPDAPDDEGYAAFSSVASHDERFHDLLFDLAGNEEARRAFARTNCHLHLFRLRYGRGMVLDTIGEHEAIVDAVVGGDAVAATAAMRRHLERSRDRILASVG